MTPRRMHWTWGESRRWSMTFGSRTLTLEKFKPLCGRWMSNDGQFAARFDEVTCDHCKAALDRFKAEHPDEWQAVADAPVVTIKGRP